MAVYVSPTEVRSIRSMIRALRKSVFAYNSEHLADMAGITVSQVYTAMRKMRKLICDNDYRFGALIHHATTGPNDTDPRYYLTFRFEVKDVRDYRELADLGGSIVNAKTGISHLTHELRCAERDLDTMSDIGSARWKAKNGEVALLRSLITMYNIRLDDLNNRFGTASASPPPPPPPTSGPGTRVKFA